MVNEKYKSGEAFLEENLTTLVSPIFYKSKIRRIIANRIFCFRTWMDLKISFLEAIRECLPTRYHSPKTDQAILENMERYIDGIFKKAGLYDRDKIDFLGKPFFKASENTDFQAWFHTFIMFFQCAVADQYRANEFIKKDSVIIDAGANAGAFSVFAATIAKQGNVYSFEPTPQTFSILEKNTSGYENIEIFQMALGNKPGDGELILTERSGSNTLSDSGLSSGQSAQKVKVKMITIDDFVRDNAIGRVDFIKMDTEGYEGKILEGAVETIRKFSPILSMSAYHHAEDKAIIPSLVSVIYDRYSCELTKKVEDNFLFRIK